MCQLVYFKEIGMAHNFFPPYKSNKKVFFVINNTVVTYTQGACSDWKFFSKPTPGICRNLHYRTCQPLLRQVQLDE